MGMTNAEALQLARTQLQVRHQQLLACRACGVDSQRFAEAIERIRILEDKYKGEEDHAVQVQQQ